MEEYRLLAQRLGLIALTNFVTGLSGLVLLPIITKNVSSTSYGVWVQISVSVALVSSIATLGLPFAIVRFLAGETNREIIKEGFYSVVFLVALISGLVSIFFFAFAVPISSALFAGDTAIVRLLSLLILINCINATLLAYLRAFQQIKRFAIISISQTYLNVVLIACAIYLNYGILGAAIGVLLSQLLCFVTISVLVWSEIGFKIPAFVSLKSYLKFGLPTIPDNVSYWVVDSSDRYVIGILLGAVFVGYYNPGYVLGTLQLIYIAPLAFILPAALSRLYEKGLVDHVKTVLQFSVKYFLAIAIPSSFGLALLSRPLLTLLTTQEIASYGSIVTPLVAASTLLFGIYTIVLQVLVLTKKTYLIAGLWVVTAALNFCLTLILIPIVGLVGAAIATLLAYGLITSFVVYLSRKYLTFDFDLFFVGKSVVSSVVMSSLIVAVRPSSTLQVIAIVIICGVVYSTLLILLKGINRSELEFFTHELLGFERS